MKGFTLVEILIYISIFVIIAGLSVGILLAITQINQRESAVTEVTGQMNFITQTINRLIRNSSNIEIAAGSTTSVLKLRMQDSAKDPTCLSLVGGVIKLAEGPDVSNPQNCTSNTSDMTNNRVVVDTLDFKKSTQYPGHDAVSFTLAISYNSTNPKSQLQRVFQSAIARVSAATFDSNLLPGSTTYEIGQSGSPWQKIYMADGTAANPSYTFANSTSLGLFRADANILGFSTAGTERMRIDASGGVTINSGGSANKAICWKSDGKTLGYCSSAVGETGSCTCN